MDENKEIINSKSISRIFGLFSDIFNGYISNHESQEISKLEKFNKKYSQWKEIYQPIYGKNSEKDLFIKHSYYISLLKRFLSSVFEDMKIPEFDLFYQEFPKIISDKMSKLINPSNLACEDLFQEIYQQIFLSTTRHSIGEFYTPSKLVKIMLKDNYIIGDKTLDPACGSGNFLIEICLQILNSKISDSDKVKALNNIYGFDINPLATATAKVNILLLLSHFLGNDLSIFPNVNIFVMDALFPRNLENKYKFLKELYNQFDLVIGNPPWLTYKDIINKSYQSSIRELAEKLDIKPPSQYITHIELAALFFYAIPTSFLKIGGIIFFVITKSVLNGDHCHEFRSFHRFKEIEIWDSPKNYHFNVNHICLKAKFTGITENFSIKSNYPIKAKLFDDGYNYQSSVNYSSLKIDDKGAKVILPETELKIFKEIKESLYKKEFFQGATLVPRALVFFQIDKRRGSILEISSDPDILLRAKPNWKHTFNNKEIEQQFSFKTFLNRDLIPFYIKKFKNVFLPVNKQLEFNSEELSRYPLASTFYNDVNEIYKKNKKESSKIDDLFSNLNYWNKLTKQRFNKKYIVVYNASGSNLKSAVIENDEKNIFIGSENYYFSTDSQNEAYYLSAIFNSPIFSKYIKLIKSSRHIHKRPFTFPIPLYDINDEQHRKLAKKAQKYYTVVQDLASNNPKITPEKVKVFLHKKFIKIDEITKSLVFEN